jgi:hypothetical protein
MHISGDGRKIGSEIKTFINKDLLNEALKKGKVAVKDNYAEISPENLAKLLTKAGLEPVNQR